MSFINIYSLYFIKSKNWKEIKELKFFSVLANFYSCLILPVSWKDENATTFILKTSSGLVKDDYKKFCILLAHGIKVYFENNSLQKV